MVWHFVFPLHNSRSESFFRNLTDIQFFPACFCKNRLYSNLWKFNCWKLIKGYSFQQPSVGFTGKLLTPRSSSPLCTFSRCSECQEPDLLAFVTKQITGSSRSPRFTLSYFSCTFCCLQDEHLSPQGSPNDKRCFFWKHFCRTAVQGLLPSPFFTSPRFTRCMCCSCWKLQQTQQEMVAAGQRQSVKGFQHCPCGSP